MVKKSCTLKNKGLDDFIDLCGRMAGGAKGMSSVAVYAAANVLADELRAHTQALRTVTEAQSLQNWRTGTPSLISVKQKQGLLDSLGVAPHQVSNYVVDTHIGFDGYNEIETKNWPSGQPNPMIARSCESGSSGMIKQPFIRPALTAARKGAIVAARAAVDEKIQELKK